VVCTAGENACPPEDVGGLTVTSSYLTAITNPLHEEHESMLSGRRIVRPQRRSARDINEMALGHQGLSVKTLGMTLTLNDAGIAVALCWRSSVSMRA